MKHSAHGAEIFVWRTIAVSTGQQEKMASKRRAIPVKRIKRMAGLAKKADPRFLVALE